MSKLEELVSKNIRKTKVQEAILLAVLSGGRVGGDLLVKQALDYLLGTDFSTTLPRRRDVVKSAASRLTKHGLVVFKDGFYSLTKNGQNILNNWQMSDYQIKKPRKWDKKWRGIIFDIPEKYKAKRDYVRNILSEVGFRRLQNSVWVYPYDCEEVMSLMKVNLGIGQYLLYMIVDQIEDDRHLRMDFDLLA